MLYCRRCKTENNGVERRNRMFVDRVYSANRNYEVMCVGCGARRFVPKGSRFGRWLANKEELFANASIRTDREQD